MSDLRDAIADVIYNGSDLATKPTERMADAILALPEMRRLMRIGAWVEQHRGVPGGDSSAAVNRGADRYRTAALAAGEAE